MYMITHIHTHTANIHACMHIIIKVVVKHRSAGAPQYEAKLSDIIQMLFNAHTLSLNNGINISVKENVSYVC